jgi:asparagine synthase (glutamine-hydrolysing)
MCGIAGIFSIEGGPIHREEIERMCEALVHRGPDDEGIYLAGRAGLGMRRLSIIDLSTGHQPLCNEDGTVWVVFNGEIYNFQSLRQRLEQSGHVFFTSTDTETIVHLYEDHGPRCVEQMSGMFALALWDERRQTLLLARDRLGIKPLYYAEVNGRLLFASELKALLQLPDVEHELNWGAVNHLFSFLTTPRSESIVAGVRKLPPGHILLARPDRPPEVRPYWDLKFEPDYSLSESSIVEELRQRVDESVRQHLVSDVPLGAFLSGGTDSSAVVAFAARHASGPLKTFSIGFDDPGFDEQPYARQVARKFGTEHYELVVQPDAFAILDDLVMHLDEPLGDPSVIPTYLVSKLAAEHVKVVLSGDGGDELFAGYEKYLVERRERRYRFLPRPIRSALGRIGRSMAEGTRGKNFLSHIELEGARRYQDASTLFRNHEKRGLFRRDVLGLLSQHDAAEEMSRDYARGPRHWLSTLQLLDLKHYLPLDILAKVDTMSMAHSIEARVPLLDHTLVEFAARIPPELMLRNGTTKYIFRRALGGILPEEIVARPKHGFAVPLGPWFRGGLNPFVHDLLLSETSLRRGIFNPSYLDRLIEWHRGGRPLDFQLWTLISFEMWNRRFLDVPPAPLGRGTRERTNAIRSAQEVSK